MKKTFFIAGWLGILGAAWIIFTASWWVLYPYQPIVFKSNYLETDKVSYKAGEILQYTADFCKNTDLNVVISRAFVDTVVYMTADTTGTNPKGCKKMKVNVEVPHLPPGVYKLKVNYIYQVNPIRVITITKYTNEFTVR